MKLGLTDPLLIQVTVAAHANPLICHKSFTTKAWNFAHLFGCRDLQIQLMSVLHNRPAHNMRSANAYGRCLCE